MEIKKEAQAVTGGTPTQAQMESINALAKARLNPEQVYVFSLRLCDDQIDRDYERFDRAALEGLAKLFIGKTGIVDHKWSSNNQVARIFETHVAEDAGVVFVKAWAYIRRGGDSDEIIADIEAGIKKEVSVGCAMGRCICSICGSEYGTCGHMKGEHYDGQLCCGILQQAVDAYEFSFVAVPAQRSAGVLKALGSRKQCLKEFAEANGYQKEFRELFKNAQLGLKYRKELEDSVVRLGLALELGAEEATLRNVVKLAASEDLVKLKEALEGRFQEMMPVVTQLGGCRGSRDTLDSGFLI